MRLGGVGARLQWQRRGAKIGRGVKVQRFQSVDIRLCQSSAKLRLSGQIRCSAEPVLYSFPDRGAR